MSVVMFAFGWVVLAFVAWAVVHGGCGPDQPEG